MKLDIPHRVRAAIALLDLEDSILRVKAYVWPELRTDEEKIYWRCATDSIWEGRLVATRWLIEFTGVKNRKTGRAKNKKSPKTPSSDVCISDFRGGIPVGRTSREGEFLAEVWSGCSKASGHPTDGGHPPVKEKDLTKAINIIVDHLQNTIYQEAGINIRDFVLRKP